MALPSQSLVEDVFFRNAGTAPLRLITVYAPPEHPAGTVHETTEEADAAEHGH